ncbi:Uncharacterized protein Y057_11918 [Fusarium fujikuroi]|nr:Uncharacterized protein Y057_11918 [Fusarium fujikuroi]
MKKGLMMGKSLDTALESHGGPLLETGRLGGSEVRLESEQGPLDLEVHVPGVQFLLDPIAMCLADIHHVVGREVEETDTGESDQENARVRAGGSVARHPPERIWNLICDHFSVSFWKILTTTEFRKSSFTTSVPRRVSPSSCHGPNKGDTKTWTLRYKHISPHSITATRPCSAESTSNRLRAPPTGPAANRNPAGPVSSPALPPPARTQTPTAPPLRSGTTSPTVPPAGPRGYVPPARGGFAPRGGRGGWNQAPARHISGPSPTPSTPNGPSAIPTGPRATPSNTSSATTTTQSRPFNPPTGPSAQHAGSARQTLAQSMLATLPPIIPGGKLDPSMTPLALGVTRELEPHYRKLKDEEEKLRDELHTKQERLRKSLYTWNRLERDSRAWEMRSDLSEKSMKNLAGEGMGGAAF